MLGTAVSPIDKLRKDSALRLGQGSPQAPVTSEKPILFFRVAGIVGVWKYLSISYKVIKVHFVITGACGKAMK